MVLRIYKFFSGVFFIREAAASLLAAIGFVIAGRTNGALSDFNWLPWALLIAIVLIGYLLYIRGILSFYPRPDFSDDFQTIANSFQNFMSDSNFYIQMKNVIHHEKLPLKLNDDIYSVHEQIERNPIKLRSIRLKTKYKNFNSALNDLIDHLDQHYFLEGNWYVTKTTAITQAEKKAIRAKTQKYLKKLASAYSSLFSEISHLGGHPFEVNFIYVEEKSSR